MAAAEASVDFGRADFRLRVAAARAAVFRFAAFVCLRFADVRPADVDFFVVRRAGFRVVLRAFDFVARLRLGDFFANGRSLSSVALGEGGSR
jgi:hypothetical protein